MNPETGSWKDLRWIEPQSRWIMQTLFKRDMDVMTDSARRTTNWGVLILDAAVLYIILSLL
jgi:hypothetical protein